MAIRQYNVLFLCVGNSAWSPMAEAIMNRMGRDAFRAYSAGLRPAGGLDPFALHQLQAVRFPVEGLRAKSWTEFTEPGAPKLDFVFSVCDLESESIHPVWLGDPLVAHWGVPDPSGFEGTEQGRRNAFHRCFISLQNRINLLMALPLEKVDHMSPLRPDLATALPHATPSRGPGPWRGLT